MTSKVIQCHIRPLLCENHSGTFIYGPIFIKICIIMKTQFFHKCHYGEVMEKFFDFFTLKPSDLTTNLTYVLMDNFCPCFQSDVTKHILQQYGQLSRDMARVEQNMAGIHSTLYTIQASLPRVRIQGYTFYTIHYTSQSTQGKNIGVFILHYMYTLQRIYIDKLNTKIVISQILLMFL